MEKKNILVLEGGGAKGPFELGALQTLEEMLNKKTYEIFDLIVCTSIGSVNASILATGVMNAKEASNLMLKNLPIVFKKRFLRIPVYNRYNYAKLYDKYIAKKIGRSLSLEDFKTKVSITSTNMCDGLNHFFKSYKANEKKLPVVPTIFKSFAAPYFFGQINCPPSKSIWLDGGIGVENLPLWEAYIEAEKLNWFKKNEVNILAIGCGRQKFWKSYEEGSKGNSLSQTITAVRYFNSIKNGSIARNQSTGVQVKNMQALSDSKDNFNFQFIDWCPMPKKLDKMDNVKARYLYYNKGKLIGKSIKTELLKR